MKKRLLILVVLFVLLTVQGVSCASNFYIIPDSGSRRLTRAELWEWQYDALGYILNEIFARYGFPFNPTGHYYSYFNSQSWYTENPAFTYDWCNSTEWYNERLVKEIRQEMRDLDTTNPGGKPLPELEPPLYNIPLGFEEYPFAPGQKLDVYSGPGYNYVRGANGKAMTSTNGAVYVYGWESGWLLALYRLNSGSGRMGYIPGSQMKDTVNAPYLIFSYQPTNVLYNCPITDDPLIAYTPLATLQKGAEVTFLCWMQNSTSWAYVEADTPAGLVRGCIPANAVAFSDDEEYK
ncbi:MAG: YARHG domain-containing protein [Clostridiales bacterium]|nr:YARHG domain-containing protein [Clostridiales bacterium]